MILSSSLTKTVYTFHRSTLSSRLHAGAALGAILALAPAAVSPALAQAISSGGSAAVSEVIVTAQKREQSVQDVPASISVVSSDLLEKLNVNDFSQFADSMPGVTFATTGVGNSQYFIRGIGQIGQDQSPTTGVYLDETPLQSRSMRGISQPDPQLFDVERVEILRGPQGVLFGSSAMGGLVRIITARPNAAEFSGKLEGSVATIEDGDESWDVKGMMNVPLVEEHLALRLVGVVGRQGGWIDDLRPVTADLSENLDNPEAIEKDANWTNFYMGRATLRWTPTDTLSITPSILYQDSDSNTDRAHSDATFGLKARRKARYQDVSAADTFWIGSLLVEQELDALGGLSVLSSSSYMDRDTAGLFDATPFGHPLIEELVGPSPAGQLYLDDLSDASNTKQFTQEVRVVSNSDAPLQFVVGAFYKTLRQRFNRTRSAPQLFGAVAPPPFGASDPPLIEDVLNRFREREYALFGELTYQVTDQLKLAAGARYLKYNQTDTRRRFGLGGEAGGILTYNFTEKNSEDGVTPRVTATYQPTSAASFYASYSRGLRTGGVNAPIPDDVCTPADREAAGLPDTPPPYKSDTTDNYELGAKTAWFDRRLRINAAAYHISWKNYQQSVQTTCGPNPVFFVANAGKVRSNGAELEVDVDLTRNLRLQLGGSYTDAVYLEPVPALGLAAGSRVLDVPEFSWNARLEYAFPITEGWEGNGMLSVRYVGESISGMGEGVPLPRPDYTLVDLVIAAKSETLTISVFANNITDEIPVYGQEFATSPDNTNATTYFSYLVGPPRTIGVRVSKAF